MNMVLQHTLGKNSRVPTTCSFRTRWRILLHSVEMTGKRKIGASAIDCRSWSTSCNSDAKQRTSKSMADKIGSSNKILLQALIDAWLSKGSRVDYGRSSNEMIRRGKLHGIKFIGIAKRKAMSVGRPDSNRNGVVSYGESSVSESPSSRT